MVVVGYNRQVERAAEVVAKAAKAVAAGLVEVAAGWVVKVVTVGWVAAMEG